MDADRDRWDERWRAAQASSGPVRALPPDVIAAHPAIVDCLPTDGPALDLACGVGAQSLWLATRGLRVTALDVSPVAIGITAAAAEINDLDVDARVWDTDEGLPADLTSLAMIVCQRYRARDLSTEFVDRLRPGGVLVLTVLSAVGCAGEAGPFHAPAGELTDAFQEAHTAGIVEVLVHDEADGQASIVLRRSEP
jgi:2-polyprenyl-3-methyl-5-hydroxy-6-metoxy-1,4-benzoquinol methylase